MKKLIIAMIAMLMVTSIHISNAQSGADRTSKEDRLERKQQKALEKQEMKEKFLALAKDQSLVLEANALADKYGNRVNVTANNFIMLDGDRVVLQTSFPARFGYNGLGGITIDGRLADYEVVGGKDNKSISITALVTSSVVGSGRLSMNISSNGYASATFSDNWGNRLYFYGNAQSLEDTRLFEGMSI